MPEKDTLPLKIIRQNVAAVEVGKYYLKSELSRVFPDDSVRSSLDATVDRLDDFSFWRLLEALSSAFRLNSVFWTASNEHYTWNQEVWAVKNLTLSGMSPEINAVTHSATVNRNPLKFKEFLLDYFAKHPQDDPLGLNQFQPNRRTVKYAEILLVTKEQQAVMLDGSNRLVKQLLGGAETITAYRAIPTDKPSLPKAGDSSFRLLQSLFAKAKNDAEREAVFETTLLLARNSADGKSAIQTYWIDHVGEEQKPAGQRLLAALSEAKNN